jgi:class 3 adenylate cyclase/WD40 repeat protein
VAFLFVDLVDSTALLHRLGADANDAVTERFQRSLRLAVARHHGVEVRSLGDGVVAAFPGALGEALGCAVDMHRDVRRVAVDGTSRLRIRVGVSVGEADRNADGEWQGTPIVEAARLVSLAKPDTILVPAVVRSLVGTRGGFAFHDVGSLDFKGFPEPIACCEVAWEAGDHSVGELPPELDLHDEPALVGRDDELARADAAIDLALAGSSPGPIDVWGPPGVGRHRFAREVASRYHAAGRGQVRFVDPTTSTAEAVADHGADDRPTLLVVDLTGRDLVRTSFDEDGAAVVLTIRDRPADGDGDGDGVGDRGGTASIELAGLDRRAAVALLGSWRIDVDVLADDAVLDALLAETQGQPGQLIDAAERVAASGALRIDDGARRSAAVRDALLAPTPYRGLLRFEEVDARRFHGREADVERVLARIERDRLVAVIGPSGVGKSSLVRAGVVPRLRAEPDRGEIVVFDAGPRPLGELAALVAPLVGSTVGDALATLEASDDGLAELLGPLGSRRPTIVVDQFEEIFTHDPDDDRRTAFLTALLRTLDVATVVLIVRADFVGRCSELPGLAAALDGATTLVGPLDADGLRAAIEQPARDDGLAIEPGLVELLLRDVEGQPGALPLLSHAIYETWRRRDAGRLTVAAYQSCGGVREAIARTADDVLASLDPTDKNMARTLLLRMTESSDDSTPDTRRRIDRREVGGLGERAEPVLERLVEARLVTSDGTSVEIAHEALIAEWPQLRSWLADDRQRVRALAHLRRASAEWDARGRDAADLDRGARLDDTVAVAGAELLTPTEREFVDASTAGATGERRRRRRGRRILIAAGILLVVAVVAGAIAASQRNRADDAAQAAAAANQSAIAGQLLADARTALPDDRYLSALLALEANRRQDDPTSKGALLAALTAEPRWTATWPTGPADRVAVLAGSGDPTAVVRNTAGVSVWNAANGTQLAQLPVAGDRALAVRSDGSAVAVASKDGTITRFDREGRPVGTAIPTGLISVSQIAFSPDGRQLVATTGTVDDGASVATPDTVRTYDVGTGTAGPPLAGHTRSVTTAAFSPDGSQLVTGGNDSTLVFHDARTGAAVGAPVTLPRVPTHVAFDPGRPVLLVGTVDGLVLAYDTTTHEQVSTVDSAGGFPWIAFSADDATFAVGTTSQVAVFDAATRQRVGEPFHPQTGAARPDFLPDGRILVAGGAGPVTAWDRNAQSVLARTSATQRTLLPFPDRRYLLSMDVDAVWRLDADTLAPVGPPLTPGSAGPADASGTLFPVGIVYSLFGTHIGVVNRAGRFQEFDGSTGATIGHAIDLGFTPTYGVYSQDNTRIAVGGQAGELVVIDTTTDTWTKLDSGATAPVLALEFSPDHHRLLVVSGTHVAMVEDLDTDHPRLNDLSPRIGGGGGPGADLSPDGRQLAIARGGVINFYDSETMAPQGPPATISSSPLIWIEYSPDGRLLVANDSNAALHLVDGATHEPVGPGLPSTIYASSFGGDDTLVGGSYPGGGIVWNVDPDEWRRQACNLAGRNLSQAEWDRFLPEQGARQATCPQYPL